MLSVPVSSHSLTSFLFFFNDTATTEIYTLSLHDALPISPRLPAVRGVDRVPRARRAAPRRRARRAARPGVLGCDGPRSEEHTSELQSRLHLVCRLLLEKKKKKNLRKLLEACRRLEDGEQV